MQSCEGGGGVGKMQNQLHLSHTAESTILTQIHNSVIGKQTKYASKQVTIGLDHKGILADSIND